MSPRRVAKPVAKIHWLSVIQFGGSAFGLAVFWAGALGALVYALVQFALPSGASDTAIDYLLVGAAMLWVGLLLIPSTVFSFTKLINRPVPKLTFLSKWPKRTFAFSFALLLLAIFLGRLVIERDLPWFLPPLHVLAATLSVAALLGLGLRNLDLGGLQRRWGSFASGLTAGPFIAAVLEFLAALVILVAVIFYVTLNPRLSATFDLLLENLRSFASNPQSDAPALRALTHDPVFIGLILTNMSLFVPLIEELAKPIAVWFLMWRRKLTAGQGFGLGLLSGAGFALAENLFSGATQEGWAETSVVRIGATAFHLATAGLMGWALVRARGQRRYLALAGVYAFNIAIHGAWNAVVILGPFSSEPNSTLPFAFPLLSGCILTAITLLSIAILIYMNRRLQPVIIRRMNGGIYDLNSGIKKIRSTPKTRR